MKMTVTKSFTFAAAHKLPAYQGKCRNLHGHEWKLDITVSGQINKQTGMIVDFTRLKGIVEHELINKLDHAYLNDLIIYPTAELIVEYIVKILPDHLHFMDVTLERVRLYENANSYVEWEI